jgi:DNA-binding transcriptional ArsR family regulator
MNDVFGALADPTRRRIVELLHESELDAGAIAAEFDISKPAISRHLRLLRTARVVSVRPEAQRRVYALETRGLEELSDWVGRYRPFWQARLDGLREQVEEDER